MASRYTPLEVDAPGSAPEHTEWLALCRRTVEAQREIFAATPGIVARTNYEGVGEGGDHSLVIDLECEQATFNQLERHHESGATFTAISEERGVVGFGDGPTRVVIDPIDGSLNARRTIPSHSLSIAIASGETMADVEFGYVFDFGAGEEFTASRGAGAWLDGEQMRAQPGEGLEIVGLEAVEPERSLPVIEELVGKAYRLRSVGSIAITLAYVAASRFDGMLSTRNCRSVDAAAAQLIAEEAGAAVAFGDLAPEDTPLGLDARFQIAGSRAPADLPVILAALARAA